MMRSRKLSCSLVVACSAIWSSIVAQPLPAEQLVLAPTSDGYALGTTDLNFTRLTTNTTQLTVYRFDNQTDQRPLFEFDASALPEGAIVTGATLEFTVVFFQTSNGADIVAFPGDGLLALSDATAAGETVGALATPTGATFKQIPLSVDGVLGSLPITNGLLTIRMQAPASGVFFNLYATEEALASRRPRLVIDYDLPPPPPRQVVIDVLPDSSKNNLSLNSKKTFPVAVFSADDFDALDIDDLTVSLGDPGLSEGTRASPVGTAVEDVDFDGRDDLVYLFAMPDLVSGGVLDAETTTLELRALDASGRQLFGSDAVTIKGASGKGNGNGK